MSFVLRTALLVSFFFAVPALAHTEEFCGITLTSSEEISFTDTEKKWLCGDSQNPAWQNIPATQKALFLKSFLQSRGYQQPQISPGKNPLHIQLLVDAGPRSYIQSYEVQNAPLNWNWQRRRKLVGRPMTPATLDEFTKWTRRRLQENGYACPQVDAKAFVDEGLYSLDVTPGSFDKFGFIENVGENELNPEILDRFTAFFPDQDFDVRLLEITSNRILAQDLYLSAYYDVVCDDENKMTLVRRLIPAKPRLLTFGIGFDSEGGALFRSTLKQARINPTADSLEASIYASLIEQSFSTKYRHYFSSDLRSRLHFVNSLIVKRQTEGSYEALTSQLGGSLAYGWEKYDHQAQVSFGPYLERTDIIVGPGPYRVDTIRLNGEVTATSHLYEYYLTSPQEGWTATLNTSTQLEGALAKKTVHRVTLNHQMLWNIDQWDPPLMILGWRGYAGSFFMDDSKAVDVDVPVTQRFFLGGDADLRGFGRKQIRGRDNMGYLTVLYQGIELRAGDVFKYNLQPLILLDAAMVGETSSRLSDTIYYSPGIGLRWGSPIGAIRSTLAHGYTMNATDEIFRPSYFFYISFGREF